MSNTSEAPGLPWDCPSPFVLELDVAESHIDGLNHVNNAVYVSWCQDAGWAHSRQLGLSEQDYQQLDCAMAIRHAEYDYVAAAYRGDRLLLGTWLSHCDGRLNMERRFQIFRERDAALILRGRWQLVSIGIGSGKAKRMPAVFRDVYGPAVISDVGTANSG